MQRRAALGILPLLAACAHAGSSTPAPVPPAAEAASSSAAAGVRYFHGNPEESFWVSRSPDLDRVVSGGARLEIAAGGQIRAAAWDADLAARNQIVTGALAVPPRLGGGFVLWTRDRAFFASEFTGPLTPLAMGATGEVAIRGARAGLSSVLLFTDAGPRALVRGAARLAPVADPALLDLVALSADRAARLDVFGRAAITADGGARWTDLGPSAGLGVRQITAGPSDLWIESFQGRFLVGPSGKLELADPPDRSANYDQPRAYQLAWRSVREHDHWPWGLRESSPMAVAVAAGAPFGDGTAFGVVQGTVIRVDLATGALTTLAPDWLPSGLTCQPIRAPDGVLFACVWERSQGYGGYVLRSTDGGPPDLERAFSEDGSFVATDDGAIGYVGGCGTEPRYVDPNDQSRWEVPTDTSIKPVICVRRGPGSWVERRVDPGEGASLVSWVPRLDGTAAAISISSDPLPPPAGAPRVLQQGGARLVRVYPEIPGWTWRRGSWQPDRAGLSGYVERRFRFRDDGSIDGWLAPVNEGTEPAAMGVTLDPSGIPRIHEVPPGAAEIVTGGSFAVALDRDGALHESTDHGRTWRAAGRSPRPAAASSQHACSALGCALGAVVRVGWGDAALAPRIASEPLPPPEPSSPPRLACVPRGAPVPLTAPPPAPAGTKHTVSTGWGDTLEIVRDADAPEPPPPPGRPGSPATPPGVAPPPAPAKPCPPGTPLCPPPAPSAAASAHPSAGRPPAKKPPRASPAVLRTHTLQVRQPFAPFAVPRRLNATDASFNLQRRTMVVPLLAPSGDVDLLVGGDQTELLVSGDKISVIPAFEARRYYSRDAGFTGLALPGGRALVLGETRRRLTLEDHGPGVSAPPIFLGLDRGNVRNRPVAIARRDDGTLGILVADGGAAETVGVAVLDRQAGSLRQPERLAPWSSVLPADDPRCKKEDDPRAWEALLLVDPAGWLAIDPASLPGVALARQGMLRVRWGTSRVCLEAIDAAATDAQRREEGARSWTLVARWGGGKDRGAVLRAGDLRQELVCRIEKSAPPTSRR